MNSSIFIAFILNFVALVLVAAGRLEIVLVLLVALVAGTSPPHRCESEQTSLDKV